MFEDDTDGNSLFGTRYVNLSWMNEEKWVIRLETRKYLEKEIKYNKNLQFIMQDLTRLIQGRSGSGKKLVNRMLLDEFEKVVLNNLNILIHIAGKTGSGKSEIAQKLALLLIDIYKKFSKANPKHIKDYSKANLFVEFTIEDANKRLKSLSPGDVLIRDEQSKASGEGSQLEKDKNMNLRKTVRGDNINFIDCQPSVVVDATLNFVIMTLGYNVISKNTIAIVFIPIASKQIEQTILHPIGYIRVKLHNNKELRKDYETRKQQYIDELKKRGGSETISLKKEDIIEDGKKLIKYIKKKNMFPQSQSEFLLVQAFSDVAQRSTAHSKKVMAYVKMELRGSNYEKPKNITNGNSDKIDVRKYLAEINPENSEDPFLNYEFDVIAALETYQSSDKKRDIQIYINFLDGTKHTDQAIKLNMSISEARVRQIIKQVEGHIDYLIGHGFEIFAAGIYENQGYEVLTDLTKSAIAGDPDLIIKNKKTKQIEILSLKISRSIKKSINPLKDCEPEVIEYINRKKKNEDVKLYLEFVNLITKDHRKIELNEKNLEHLKSIALF